MLFVPRKFAGNSETYTHHNKTKEKTTTYTQINWRYIQHEPVPPVPINTTGSFKRLALSYQTKNFEFQPNPTKQNKRKKFISPRQNNNNNNPFFTLTNTYKTILLFFNAQNKTKPKGKKKFLPTKEKNYLHSLQ